MNDTSKIERKTRRKLWLRIPLGILLLLIIAAAVYFNIYYHATAEAKAALESTKKVTVTEIRQGYRFDGPGEGSVFVFYPGAKVEETAYAPLMMQLAERGVDSILVKMPLRFALFATDRVAELQKEYDYSKWYLGGHSLGGVAAAMYGEDHAEELDGMILVGAYPANPIPDELGPLLSVYGTEDGILRWDEYDSAKEEYWPSAAREVRIRGGNHAGFGNYGAQRGDGKASISAEKQQKITADNICEMIIGTGSGN